jgi:uncharacterized protein (TIGR03118 family)
MTILSHRSYRRVLALAGVLTMTLVLALAFSAIAGSEQKFYQETDLVSNIQGRARNIDTHLKNPWGMASSSTSPFWVSDNGTGVTTLYNGAGQAFPVGSPLVVTIPPPPGSAGPSTPTGQVFNGTADFVVSKGGNSGPSVFIFATEDGTISGWNPCVPPPSPSPCPPIPPFSTTAVLAVDNSGSGAVYKGLAIGSNASGNFLYAANFHAGTIDVFDKDFHTPNPPLAGSFSDPDLPAGFAPFNIQNLEGDLYVTYAKQDADKKDDVKGKGNGFVDIFDTDGNFIQRVDSRSKLNSPWGLVFAPGDFGRFSHDLLVGNFGDGRINAYSREGDHFHFHGQLQAPDGQPVSIEGLWALRFGNGGAAGPINFLFFTAGINDEADGLFGSLTACQKSQCQ